MGGEVSGIDDGRSFRWWLSSIIWAEDGPFALALNEEENRGLMDTVNLDVLPLPVEPKGKRKNALPDGEDSQETPHDVPLVRLSNFLRELNRPDKVAETSEHLTCTYQLEQLRKQAVGLLRGRWRNLLFIDFEQMTKTLQLKYWPYVSIRHCKNC